MASADCIPDTSRRKNGSTPRVSAGRANTSPTAPTREPPSARAALFGRHSISAATCRISLRVYSDTPGRLLSANDTALSETPALRAISRIVTRRLMA
ncbi:hypothetical protein GCM10029964_040220 [Kibdelosporangium lantanae]